MYILSVSKYTPILIWNCFKFDLSLKNSFWNDLIHVYSAISISSAVKYKFLVSFLCTLSFKFEIKRYINDVTRNKWSAVLYLRISTMFFRLFQETVSATLTTLLSSDIDKSATLMSTGHVFILWHRKFGPLFPSLNKW